MFPFINIFKLKLPLYGLCITLGIFLAALVSYFLVKRIKQNFYDFIIVSALAVAFGFAGAKLLYILVSFPIKDFFYELAALFSPFRGQRAAGGFVFYGGFIFGIAGFFIGTKIAQVKASTFSSIYLVVLPLAHAFGRIGCFFAGCCWGLPTQSPVGIIFTHPLSTAPAGTPLVPVQLFEAAALLCIFFVTLALYLKNIKPRALAYPLLYSVARFILEFFRGDTERGFLLNLSTSQVISIAVFAVTVGIAAFKKQAQNKAVKS